MDSGLPGFPPWRPSWWYSRTVIGERPFSRTGLSPSLVGLSRHVPLTDTFVTPSWTSRSTITPHNTRAATPAGYHAARVWAIPVSLATTQGMLSFPRGTEMFQFPRCPPTRSMYSSAGSQGSTWLGFPIRISPDHRLLPTPRSFSQVTASFIGLLRQGIHRTPFVA